MVPLVFANAFQYPAPGLFEQLELETTRLPGKEPKGALCAFLAEIGELSLGEWEELYTRTWDLDPLTAPYIGFHIWGEDYRRGNFLARLQSVYWQYGITTNGELPDHLVPVLRYLSVAEPIDELAEVIGPALAKMAAALREKDEENPYLGLIEACMEVPWTGTVSCS